jgi:hypothetical protein
MRNASGRNGRNRNPTGDESGIIVFGGGGGGRRGGCLGRGCLFWILLSVALTVLVNLVLLLFSGGGSGSTSDSGRGGKTFRWEVANVDGPA